MMKMMSISCLRNVLTNMRHLTGLVPSAKPGTRLWERLILPFVKGITTGLAETWECRSSRRACTNVFSH